MSNRLVHVGFGNYLSTDRIVAVAVPGAAPLKRSVRAARDKGLVVDLTSGRKTKSVVVTDSGILVLSALEPSTINGRLLDIKED